MYLILKHWKLLDYKRFVGFEIPLCMWYSKGLTGSYGTFSRNFPFAGEFTRGPANLNKFTDFVRNIIGAHDLWTTPCTVECVHFHEQNNFITRNQKHETVHNSILNFNVESFGQVLWEDTKTVAHPLST